MSKRRSHGKIDSLPDIIKQEVESRLIEGHTYAQIAEYLKGMGKDIHPMSVQRYGKPFLERFEAIRMARSVARAISEDNIDRPTTELHEANNAMISQILMETLISDDIEPGEKIKAATAIAQLQSAQVRNEKLKIDARKANGEIKTALNALKTELFSKLSSDYPELSANLLEVVDEVSSKIE